MYTISQFDGMSGESSQPKVKAEHNKVSAVADCLQDLAAEYKAAGIALDRLTSKYIHFYRTLEESVSKGGF